MSWKRWGLPRTDPWQPSGSTAPARTQNQSRHLYIRQPCYNRNDGVFKKDITFICSCDNIDPSRHTLARPEFGQKIHPKCRSDLTYQRKRVELLDGCNLCPFKGRIDSTTCHRRRCSDPAAVTCYSPRSISGGVWTPWNKALAVRCLLNRSSMRSNSEV